MTRPTDRELRRCHSPELKRESKKRWCLTVFAAFLAALTSFLSPAYGNAYFVDADRGNDEWEGTEAAPTADQSNGPWRSLRRVNVAQLVPGDGVNLRCGGQWREQLLIRRGGAPGNPITVKPYGSECSAKILPIINAADPVIGWRAINGAIHSAPIPFQPHTVFVDGKYLPPARYPPDGFLATEATAAKSMGIHNETLRTLRGKDLVGATVRIRTVDWKIEERAVAAFDDAGTLVYDKATEYPVRKDTGYYLFGKPWMLAYPGAWAYDDTTGELLAWLPDGSSPARHDIEVARLAHGLTIVGANNVHIAGLGVRHARTDGVTVTNSHHVTLENLEVEDSGRDGIVVTGGQHLKVKKNVVRRSERDGIVSKDSRNIAITENLVMDSGTVGPPANSHAAINVDSTRAASVERNTVTHAGYIGIRFKRDARIYRNRITDSCLVLDDCGSIYVWANDDAATPLNSEVIGNIVVNARGNPLGKSVPETLTAGIYLDDLSNGITVSGNSVTGADVGVYIHNGFNLTIEANTLSANRRAQILLGMDHVKANGRSLTGNRIAQNTLRYDSSTLGVEIMSRYPGVRHALFDDTRYEAAGTNVVAFETSPHGKAGYATPPALFTLDRWRTERRQEPNGRFSRIAPREAGGGFVPFSSSFSSGMDGWGFWSPDGAGRAFQRARCKDGANRGCMELQPGPQIVLAYSRPFVVQPGQSCEVRIRARSQAPDNPLQVRVRRSTAPFSAAGLATQILAGPSWDPQVIPFRTNPYGADGVQLELKAAAMRNIQVSDTQVVCRPATADR